MLANILIIVLVLLEIGALPSIGLRILILILILFGPRVTGRI